MKRTILVTGANRGIGLAIAQGLAVNKADIILLGCRQLAAGTRVAAQIGTNARAVQLDLSEPAGLERQLSELKKSYPRVDVLVNNAGVLIEGDCLSIDRGRVAESLQVNTLAPLALIQALVPTMLANDYGRIVNLSSGWGSFASGLSGPFAYSLSKAALNALTVTLARQLRGNVKVNSVCPGWVRTDMGGAAANRSPEEGAATALWLANLPADGPSGGFYRDRRAVDW